MPLGLSDRVPQALSQVAMHALVIPGKGGRNGENIGHANALSVGVTEQDDF
jgi:hypothetical protein